MDPFKKRNLFASLVPFLCCLNFTAAISIIHSDVPTSLVCPMWKRLVTVSPKFPIKPCQIFRQTMRTLLQDLAQKNLKGLGTKAWTNWEDRSANSLAYQISDHSTFFLIYWMSQSAEFSSGGSHFAPLQRIRLCLRTSGWCAHSWYFLTEHAWRYVLQCLSSPIIRSRHSNVYFHFGELVKHLKFHHNSFLEYFLSELWQHWHSPIVTQQTLFDFVFRSSQTWDDCTSVCVYLLN